MTLEELIRTSDETALIEDYLPRDEALSHIRSVLQKANDNLLQRSPHGGDTLTESSLVDEHQRSPHKVKAFLQAIRETASPDILVMAWRVLQGWEVNQVDLRYKSQSNFYLQIRLSSPQDGSFEEFQSSNIDDAAIFRHLGILKMNDRPVFDGFYALNR